MLGVPTVRTGCQNDLNDKRERNWDDEVIDLLDNEYRDWRHPSRTYMVPCMFPFKKRELSDGEQTEKMFFCLLQEFGESRSEGMFVIHSYNFAELISEWNKKSNRKEEKWLIGEHDFVVIHQQWGIIFFQVKAADKTSGKFAQAAKQIDKDKKSLQAFIEENVQRRKKRKIDLELLSTYPGFVVMPNCPLPDDSVVNPPTGVFKEDCENVEAFSKWWDKNVKRVTGFDQELYEYLVMRFVGMSHSIPYTLSKSIDQNKEVLEMCTTEQLSVMLNSVPEQWITGPAGSGKTWLLMKKVLMLAQNALLRGTEEKILVACYNRPLFMMFAKVFEDKLISFLKSGELKEVVEVKTFQSLLFDITGSRCGDSDQEKEKYVAQALEVLEQGSVFTQQYDHVFVDECQDLRGNRWPTLFKRLLKDEDDDCLFGEPKHIWFFYDTNQHLSPSEEQCTQHWKSIRRGLKLTKVLRSTESVFDQSKKYFGANNSNAEPIKLGHRVRGLEITWDSSLKNRKVTEDAGAACIMKHIKKLRRNKVDNKDICILTENVGIRDDISSELNNMGIETQNAEDLFLYNSPENKVVVESIWRFKGLESKVVVLYNPRFFQDTNWVVKKVKEVLYTAVSRCFCYLIVITTKHGCNTLKSEKGISERISIHQSSNRLESKQRSQMNSLFNDSFSKEDTETHYESGPSEPESPFKRSFEDDDDDSDPKDIKGTSAKHSRKD